MNPPVIVPEAYRCFLCQAAEIERQQASEVPQGIHIRLRPARPSDYQEQVVN